jgi:hypothetical protein
VGEQGGLRGFVRASTSVLVERHAGIAPWNRNAVNQNEAIIPSQGQSLCSQCRVPRILLCTPLLTGPGFTQCQAVGYGLTCWSWGQLNKRLPLNNSTTVRGTPRVSTYFAGFLRPSPTGRQFKAHRKYSERRTAIRSVSIGGLCAHV